MKTDYKKKSMLKMSVKHTPIMKLLRSNVCR